MISSGFNLTFSLLLRLYYWDLPFLNFLNLASCKFLMYVWFHVCWFQHDMTCLKVSVTDHVKKSLGEHEGERQQWSLWKIEHARNNEFFFLDPRKKPCRWNKGSWKISWEDERSKISKTSAAAPGGSQISKAKVDSTWRRFKLQALMISNKEDYSIYIG